MREDLRAVNSIEDRACGITLRRLATLSLCIMETYTLAEVAIKIYMYFRLT